MELSEIEVIKTSLLIEKHTVPVKNRKSMICDKGISMTNDFFLKDRIRNGSKRINGQEAYTQL